MSEIDDLAKKAGIEDSKWDGFKDAMEMVKRGILGEIKTPAGCKFPHCRCDITLDEMFSRCQHRTGAIGTMGPPQKKPTRTKQD